MLHTLAWAASLTNNVETDLAPVVDDIFTIQNAHFQPQKDWQLQWAIFMNVDAARARWVSAALRQVTTPFIRPVEGNLTPGSRPLVADYRSNPLTFKALEEISVLAFQDGAGAANAAIIAGVSEGPLQSVGGGQIYNLRGTATTAAVANVWTSIAVTWQDNLPAGKYVVVGGEHISATGKGFRLIFEDNTYRPGGVSMSDPENGTHPMFRGGGLGVWGSFNSNRMPNVQVLANTTDAVHEVFLDIMRIG